MEGDSVNLTCSSDANPPVQNYSWFRGIRYIGSGRLYIISKIRSDQSGQYKCKSSNELGQKYSAVTLNVLYPPKNVTASISGSGELMEGDSVTLTCSSESNPPVQIYSWFKVNETSSVGSGQTYSITNINSSHSGWFYCEAQNEVGSQTSAAVLVTVNHRFNYNLLFGIKAACGGLFIIIITIIMLIMYNRKRKQINNKETSAINENEGDVISNTTYTNVDLKTRSSNLYNTLSSQTVYPENPEETYTDFNSSSPIYENLSSHVPTADYINTVTIWTTRDFWDIGEGRLCTCD
ncbi:B-cell receptor CD22-like [Paramisgurnus dabryanus]|uniref:B-cell receptor CD22-like n=1 Tax=Paramisgurnus dabryanus TaxID=90735 RepID=UPI003CCF7605